MNILRLYLLALAAVSSFVSITGAAEASPEELSVYHALFASEHLVVLRGWGEHEEMNPEFFKVFAVHHDSIVADKRRLFPTAEAATIESFFTRRELPALLTPKTDFGVRCAVIETWIYRMLYPGMRDMGNAALRARGWSAFRQRYPRATAVTYVSRVGFNAASTQALVFLQQTVSPIPADEQRHSILLDRRNDAWVVTQREKD